MTEEGTRTSKGQIVSDSRESNDNRAVGAQAPAARVRLKRLPHAEGLELPSLATPGSAGVDLAAAIEGEITIAPGGRDIVPTGFMLAIPAGFEGQVRPRSGLALRNGIVVPNSPGTIDADYRGEVKVILLNAGTEPFVIKRGDRIAQLVIAPVVTSEFCEVEDLDETERGEGGFGHTGRE
jgi:dUTP pyrophosphatase